MTAVYIKVVSAEMERYRNRIYQLSQETPNQYYLRLNSQQDLCIDKFKCMVSTESEYLQQEGPE